MALTGEDIKSFVKKQPIGVACGVACILCGVAFYLRIDAVNNARDNLDAKNTLAQKYQNNLRNAAGLPEHAQAMQAAGKELDGRLLRVNQLAMNQQYFYRLESETGIKLVDVKQTNVAANPKAKSRAGTVGIPFNVTAQGDFRQIVSFLQNLENGAHFARFLTVSLQPYGVSSEAGSSGGGGTMSVSVSLELLGLP
jgi:hypothetical protein